MKKSKVFISYSWEDNEHKNWVKVLAHKLRTDGVDVKLDQWELKYGDQLPHFMEQMITDNDFILVICTPTYKDKSDKRIGGVGYEGDIISNIKLSTNNQRKFIPVIRKGDFQTSIPTWLSGIYGIDFRMDMSGYEDLHATLNNSEQKKAPSLGGRTIRVNLQDNISLSDEIMKSHPIPQIKIAGIITDEVVLGSRDGTKGSGLDKIPFLLSGYPDQEWIDIFVRTWNSPPSFSTMHRPRIASIMGNKLFLNGTTIEEVRDYHRNTLQLVLRETNHNYNGIVDERISISKANKRREDEQKRQIDDIAKGLNFE